MLNRQTIKAVVALTLGLWGLPGGADTEFDRKTTRAFKKIEQMMKEQKGGAADAPTLPSPAPSSQPLSGKALQTSKQAKRITCPSNMTRVEEAATAKAHRNEHCEDDDGLRQGQELVWHTNGRLRAELSYLDDKLHGKYKMWFDDGKLQAQGEAVKGKYHGMKTEWYQGGKRLSVMRYIRGVFHGKQEVWGINGRRLMLARFNRGKLLKMVKWDERGRVIPQPKLVFKNITTHSRRAVSKVVSAYSIAEVVKKVHGGLRLTQVEVRWPRVGSTGVVVFHVAFNKAAAKVLRGGAYLDYGVIKKIDLSLRLTVHDIADALNATYGQYGVGANAGLMARLRLVGRRSSVEMEFNCGPQGDQCGPWISVDCLRRGRKRSSLSPSWQGHNGINMLTIGPEVNPAGKPTGTKCHHDLWR